MSRELKRVPMDFSWPMGKVWSGYLNDYASVVQQCDVCEGDGSSPEARGLKDRWYGYVPFQPKDRDSVPFQPRDPAVWAFAVRNVRHAPDYYGLTRALQAHPGDEARSEDRVIFTEAARLSSLFNGSWSHHVNADDVAALLKWGRLHDLTQGRPGHIPSPSEVNTWSISGLGHDSINAWTCIEAECERLNLPKVCTECAGEGQRWTSPEAKAAYEAWERMEPPVGNGYQMWSTVSAGCPISPVFSTPQALADWLARNRQDTVDKDTSADSWMAFIMGDGWAPSLIMTNKGVVTGVEAVAEL